MAKTKKEQEKNGNQTKRRRNKLTNNEMNYIKKNYPKSQTMIIFVNRQ